MSETVCFQKNASSDLSSLLESLKVTHPEDKGKAMPPSKLSASKPEAKQLTVQQLFRGIPPVPINMTTLLAINY